MQAGYLEREVGLIVYKKVRYSKRLEDIQNAPMKE